MLRCGGSTRGETVHNGLLAMAATCRDDDWIVVHDAARPCVPRDALLRLVVQLEHDAVGGLLAVPVADTLKREMAMPTPRACCAPRIARGLWQAQTPQMFRYGVLVRAFGQAGARNAPTRRRQWKGSAFRRDWSGAAAPTSRSRSRMT